MHIPRSSSKNKYNSFSKSESQEEYPLEVNGTASAPEARDSERDKKFFLHQYRKSRRHQNQSLPNMHRLVTFLGKG